jgi:hypothetical protein
VVKAPCPLPRRRRPSRSRPSAARATRPRGAGTPPASTPAKPDLDLVDGLFQPSFRRAAHVRVTAQGRKLSRVIEDAVTAEVSQLVGVLSKAERERLTGLVGQIVASVGGDLT